MRDERDTPHSSDSDPSRRPPRRRWGSHVVVELRSPLALPVLVVGVVGGLIGAAYVGGLTAIAHWLGPEGHGALVQVLVLVAVGAAVTVATRLLGDSGNVELLVDNIHVLGGSDDVHRLRSLVPTSLLCIGAGGTLGPEAPLVQTCGTVGTWLARRFHLDAADRRILTITGMAAGFSVLFGAPLGAALFALEILHRRGLQYYEALLPALVGSLAGYAAYVGLTGLGLEPLWQLPEVGSLHATDLAWALGVGVLGAVAAMAFTYAASGARRLADLLPPVTRPAVGGAVLGALALWSPFALTNGETQVAAVATGAATAGFLAVALAAKLLGTLAALGTRWKGGFIIPLFFAGIAGGRLVHLAFPSSNQTVVMVALAAALCVGVTKTPLGSTLAVTQMAGLPLFPMTLVAAVIALVLTSGTTMIHTQRERTAVFDRREGDDEDDSREGDDEDRPAA